MFKNWEMCESGQYKLLFLDLFELTVKPQLRYDNVGSAKQRERLKLIN